MKTLSVLIVEDDLTASNLLKNFVKVQGDATKIEAVSSARKGMIALEQYQPDLIFLDINMPEQDGLEFAHKIKELGIDSHIVFTTAFSKYAISAFELKPLDYLLKPFGMEDVNKVLKKVLKLKSSDYESLKDAKLCFFNHQLLVFKRVSEIFYFNSKGGNAYVHDINGNVEKLSMTLEAITELINKYNFIRVNRSNIINLDYLVNIDFTANGTLEYKELKKVFRFGKESLKELEQIGILKIK